MGLSTNSVPQEVLESWKKIKGLYELKLHIIDEIIDKKKFHQRILGGFGKFGFYWKNLALITMKFPLDIKN